MRFPPRFSIAGLMAAVLVTSLSLAALLSGSETCCGGLYLLTHGVLVLAVVGAVCRPAFERAWWLGFALFGLGYLRGAFWNRHEMHLPTTAILNILLPIGVKYSDPYGCYWVVGHCLWSLLAALIGGMLALALFSAQAGESGARDTAPQRGERPARAGWYKLAAAGLAGFVAWLALVFVVGAQSDPALWAGAVYWLTWVVLGFAALGFACGHGRRRMIWFGAAFFGLGYMVLTRSPDGFEETSYAHLVADQFLTVLRPWLPPVVSGFPAETSAISTENVRIQKAIDQPIPMQFHDGARLEDVLEYIQTATRTPDGREIRIYVDPIGLQEAEKTMESPIQIDLLGCPLRTTLRLSLKQLGMLYDIRDGMVQITYDDGEVTPVVDYYLLLGHCYLSLLAAGLGALLVPLVYDRRAEPPG